MTCLIFSVNWVIGVCLLHHQLVKTCPDFESVFRQLLSGARTQLQLPGPYEMQEIFPGGSAQPLKIRAGSIMLEKGRALGPSLFFSAHHSGYRPCA
jgi:hypothetical protein